MTSSPDQIQSLIERLRAARIDADYRQLEEALWLSRTLPAGDKGGVESRPAVSPLPLLPDPPAQSKAVFEPEEYKPEPVQNLASETSTTEIFAGTEGVGPDETIPATRIRAPGTAALPEALEIGRKLRPFLRRKKSRRVKHFDEAATVERSAEMRTIVPVFTPGRERWFDVALVVEDNSPMQIWRETIGEFRRLLEHHGAFRDVRLWRLRIESDGARLVTDAGATRPPMSIKDPDGGRLICFLTNGVSVAWRNGAIGQTLVKWAASGPTAIIQVLGERLWSQTMLGEPSAEVRSLTPGSPNRLLEVAVEWYEEKSPDRIALPLITLDPRQIDVWARTLMGNGGACPAALLPFPPRAIRAQAASPSVDERMAAFRRQLSETAYQLAIYLSIVPLQLPVMRLVQHVMLPESRLEHLSEVLLGGIVKRAAAPEASIDDDEIHFDFYEVEIRERLQSEISRTDLFRVLDEVSEYVRRHIDASFDFRAYVPDPEGEEQISARALPFAQIATAALGRFGVTRRRRVPASVLEARKRLAIFLAHAEADRSAVAAIVQRLKDEGFSPWRFFADQKNATEPEIEAQIVEAVQLCDVFIHCVSPAYHIWETEPTEASARRLFVAQQSARVQPMLRFTMPARLIECELPAAINRLPAVDLFSARGWSDLIRYLDDFAARKKERSSREETTIAEIDHRIAYLASEDSPQPFMEFLKSRGNLVYNRLLHAIADPELTEHIARLFLTLAIDGDKLAAETLQKAVVDHPGEISVSILETIASLERTEVWQILIDLLQRGIKAGAYHDADGSVNRVIQLLEQLNFEFTADFILQILSSKNESLANRVSAAKSLSRMLSSAGKALRRIRMSDIDSDIIPIMPHFIDEVELCKEIFRAYVYIGGVTSLRSLRYSELEPVDQYQLLLSLIDQIIRETEFGDRKLSVHEYTVVKLNEVGEEIQRYERSAGYFEDVLSGGVTIKMVAISGGEFLMGSLKGNDQERPQHRVVVPSFYMGMHSVTQAQWRAVARMKRVERDLKPEPSTFKGDDRPVERVSWEDTQEFCRRLSRATRKAYRLPSEAEWEYACRAGTTTLFHFGPTITSEHANYNGSYPSGLGPAGINRNETTPVDFFNIANDFGLYNMHGNVWEWCEDEWHNSYDGPNRPDDGTAWVSSKNDMETIRVAQRARKLWSNKSDSEDIRNLYVVRGGSWSGLCHDCSCAHRDYGFHTDDFVGTFGFRVVVSSVRS
jgi:formylglycine-generating enzyme required for sulfatase activity